MRTLNLNEMENVEGGGRGQAVADCMADAYSNHGWYSVGLTFLSAIEPAGIFFVGASCMAKNM